MIGILLAVLIAALVFWVCLAVHLPWIVAVVAAVLVILAGFGGVGGGRRIW